VFNLQGESNERRPNFSWTTCLLKLGPIVCHEASVSNYQHHRSARILLTLRRKTETTHRNKYFVDYKELLNAEHQYFSDIHKYYTTYSLTQPNSLSLTFIRKATCVGVSQSAIIRPSDKQLVYQNTTPKHVAFLINVNNKEFGCVRLYVV
jgi:hypothetical protein